MSMSRSFAFVVAALLAGCTETRAPITGTQSLQVELISPAETGSVDQRLPDTQRDVVVNLAALDAEASSTPRSTQPVQVYAQFLGTLTPELEQTPLATIHDDRAASRPTRRSRCRRACSARRRCGSTTATGLGPTTSTARSPARRRRCGTATRSSRDLQTPRDEMALDALSTTPLETSRSRVSASRYGAQRPARRDQRVRAGLHGQRRAVRATRRARRRAPRRPTTTRWCSRSRRRAISTACRSRSAR